MGHRNYEYIFEKNDDVQFSVYDYVVFGTTLFLSASIGLFYAIKDRRKHDTEEFLLGGRDLHVVPVSLSLLSSFISAITLLGTPAEVYRYNTMYWWISVAFIVTGIGSAHIFIPVFYELRVTSIFEYVEMRFGRLVRVTASVMYLIWMLLYMAIVLYGPSLALNAVTGISLWGSIIAVSLVCIFYTTLGGMKAVVWTDTLQMAIMFAGMLTLLIEGSMRLGGFGKAWEIADRNNRILFFEFDPDPATRHTVWNIVFGGGIFWCSIYGINQAQYRERYHCQPWRKLNGLALWLNLPGMAAITTLVCLVGVVMYAFYSDCDPVSLGIIQKSDQLIPLFAMDLVGHLHGLPGLILSCVFSGSLSTISSGLNAASAVILEDFVKPCCLKIKPLHATIVSKITVIVAGFVCLALAFLVSKIGAILQAAYTLHGILGGPLLGLFVLGMVFPWSNKWGALTGSVTALGFMLWIGLGATINKVVVTPLSHVTTDGCHMINNISSTTTSFISSSITTTTTTITTNSSVIPIENTSEPFILYTLSYMWYSATAMLTTVIIGLIVSFITGYTRPETLDPRLICPIFDVFFPFLPETIRKPLRFGVPTKKGLKNVTTSELPLSSTTDDFNKSPIDEKILQQQIEESQQRIIVYLNYDEDKTKF